MYSGFKREIGWRFLPLDLAPDQHSGVTKDKSSPSVSAANKALFCSPFLSQAVARSP